MKNPLSIQAFLLSLKIISIADKFAGRLLSRNYDIVLCFHDIGNNNWEFSASKNQFEEQIKAIEKQAKIVSLSEILRKVGSRPRMAITFDDGYKGVYKYAYPVLAKRGIVGAVFVVGNKDISKSTGYKAPLLNKREIKVLKKAGWEIGFHTTTHPNLTKLNIEELNREIKIGKEKLQKDLGFKLNYFAYPFGIYNNGVETAVSQSGFKAAFTVDGGFLNAKNKFAINRVTVAHYIQAETLVALVSPLGLSLNKIFTGIWRIKDSLTD